LKWKKLKKDGKKDRKKYRWKEDGKKDRKIER
jgi:hypothetical protein